MAKKQSAGEAAAEAAKKRRSQKKTAAAKAVAKKPPPKPSKPAKKPAKKPREAPVQVELPMAGVDPVEPADRSAAPPADSTIESAPVAHAAPGELAASEAEEIVEVDDQPPALSPEEQELATLYGDDLTKPAIVHTEYTDRQTADEDRPMVPEINARDERKQQWQERRDRRRQRRDERDRQRHERREQSPRPPHVARPDQRPGEPGRGAPEPRPPHPQPQRPMPPPPAPAAPATNGQDHDALGRVGTPLGDAAATVFAQLRNGQPLPVRQLAAMMRKRNLIESDPEQLWP